MTKIFISYHHKDGGFARDIGNGLKEAGYQITADFETLSAGQQWQSLLTASLKDSDIFVVLLSHNFLSSQYVIQEIGAARAYASESERMLIIPIMIDDIPIPAFLRDIHVLYALDRNVEMIVNSINQSWSAFVGSRAAREERAVKVAEKIEKNAATFIDEAVQAQTVAERRNRIWGVAWYTGGFLALIGGLAFAFASAWRGALSPGGNWLTLAETVLRSVIVIGFLAACARYAFSLGKSYISESLKCSDRIHAIAFGKFYLQAYGEKATWPELKEVFQHWNIDRSSTFSALDVSAIDPQILSLFGSALNAALSKKK